MVRAMIQLAQSLGMTPLAEGIETRGELRVPPSRTGAGSAQGFLFAGPSRPPRSRASREARLTPRSPTDASVARRRGVRYHLRTMARRYDPPRSSRSGRRSGRPRACTGPPTTPTIPRPRFYALDMFPYPSGDLHMGHAEAFSGGDAVARFRRDAGLQRAASDRMGRLRPAGGERRDQARHPSEGMDLREHRAAAPLVPRMGMSFDWSRRLKTCDPEYYRWTQWLFLQFFERGLAYRKAPPANWCPNDQTVLANEQVIQAAASDAAPRSNAAT